MVLLCLKGELAADEKRKNILTFFRRVGKTENHLNFSSAVLNGNGVGGAAIATMADPRARTRRASRAGRSCL